jgi:hydroxymethylpyrimidine pyrophosphatase-like HAD family hydrolase
MNQATDEQIIEWIKSHRFSDLTFLNDCWKESNNEKYIGFYYFINEIKNEDIEEIWGEIVNRNKNEAGAYFYLGLIANEIFNSFDKYHISEFFYRKSMELDNSNSEVLWKLYRVTRNNDKLALKSILIDFEHSRYNEIERKLYNIYPCFSEHSGFSQSDWLMLKNVLLDENVKLTKNNSILISAYFNLHEFDEGIDLINNEDKLSFDVIKPFYDKGLVDQGDRMS